MYGFLDLQYRTKMLKLSKIVLKRHPRMALQQVVFKYVFYYNATVFYHTLDTSEIKQLKLILSCVSQQLSRNTRLLDLSTQGEELTNYLALKTTEWVLFTLCANCDNLISQVKCRDRCVVVWIQMGGDFEGGAADTALTTI